MLRVATLHTDALIHTPFGTKAHSVVKINKKEKTTYTREQEKLANLRNEKWENNKEKKKKGSK